MGVAISVVGVALSLSNSFIAAYLVFRLVGMVDTSWSAVANG